MTADPKKPYRFEYDEECGEYRIFGPDNFIWECNSIAEGELLLKHLSTPDPVIAELVEHCRNMPKVGPLLVWSLMFPDIMDRLPERYKK